MKTKSISVWVNALLLIILCIPDNALIQGNIKSAWNLCAIFAFCWSYVVFLRSKLWLKKSLYPVWAFLFFGLLATALNKTNIMGQSRIVVFVFSSCVLTEYLIWLKGRWAYGFVAALFACLMILQAVSAVTGFLGYAYSSNDGLYPNYLFGLRVNISDIWVYFIAIGSLCFVEARKTKKKLAFFIILGLASGIYFMFYESVSTAIISFAVFYITLILTYINKQERLWRFALVGLIAFVLIFVLFIGEDNAFSWLLVDILGEGMTLNGRTYLWEQALGYMDGWHWIFGNGYGHSYRFFLGNSWNTGSSHSQYLNVLFYYGMLGFTAYVLMLATQIKQINKQRNSLVYKRLIMAAITAIVVTGIPTTTINSVYMYICYTLIVNNGEYLSSQIVKEKYR